MEAIQQVTPTHYAGKVTPWDLQKCMQSSGDPFVDSRRADALKYAFRLKGDLRGDLLKAVHCLRAAIDRIDNPPASSPKQSHE